MTVRATYTEQELVMLLKQRQQQAFSYLYDNYSGALYSVILAITPDKEISSDILQEVFVKIWKQIESYDVSKGRLFTWMMNIARNAAIDMLRSKSYRQQGQNHELNELVYNVASTGAKNTDLIGLRKIVHMLDEDYKSLVDLAYFQGFTQDEISKMLNIPLGTVKTRLRNALIKLRSML